MPYIKGLSTGFLLSLETKQHVLMYIVCDLQLLDRDDSHQDDHESQSAKSPLHLAVSPSHDSHARRRREMLKYENILDVFQDWTQFFFFV